MKNRLLSNFCVIALGAVALVAASFQLATASLPPAKAPIQDRSVRFLSSPIIFGIAPGQTARFCVGTVNPRGPELDWTGKISDERGTLLFQLPQKHSPAGEWRCSDAPRSALGVTGEPGTGRAQVASILEVRAPTGTKSADLVGAFNLINNADGSTAAGGLIFWAITHEND